VAKTRNHHIASLNAAGQFLIIEISDIPSFNFNDWIIQKLGWQYCACPKDACNLEGHFQGWRVLALLHLRNPSFTFAF
jgi:hypothetical protein